MAIWHRAKNIFVREEIISFQISGPFNPPAASLFCLLLVRLSSLIFVALLFGIYSIFRAT